MQNCRQVNETYQEIDSGDPNEVELQYSNELTKTSMQFPYCWASCLFWSSSCVLRGSFQANRDMEWAGEETGIMWLFHRHKHVPMRQERMQDICNERKLEKLHIRMSTQALLAMVWTLELRIPVLGCFLYWETHTCGFFSASYTLGGHSP